MSDHGTCNGISITTEIDVSKISPSNSLHSVTSTNGSLSDSPSSNEMKQEKVCVVCGDTATGTHFAAMTCEGCKGFFRRSMKKSVQFTCAFEKKCAINKSNRKHCQACRLKKCLAVGMNSSLIMSDECVERKRELIRVNREKKASLKLKRQLEEMASGENRPEASPDSPVSMMPEDEALIRMMLESHNSSYDFDYKEYESFRGTQHVAQPAPKETKKSSVLLAWLMAGNSDKKSPEESPSSSGKTKKKSREDKDIEPGARAKRIKAEPQNHQDLDGHRINSSCPGEVLEVFNSLHGISQPKFGISQVSAPSSTPLAYDSSYYSDGSGCSASASPHQPSINEKLDIDAFSPGFSSSFPMEQSAGDMMSASGDFFGMIPSDMDSMSMLQDLFMNRDLQNGKPHSLFQHFCDIMTWGIKKVIEFCKCIPEFQQLTTVDQINLLRGGCLEMLVLRSYFAFASDGVKYVSDKFEYSPTDFLTAGVNSEFVEQYTKVHMRMRRMNLKVEEICLLIGLVLFSPDRPGVQECEKVEVMQKRIAQALRAYEYTHHEPEKACVVYSELLLLLPVLRTINVLFSNTILTLKSGNSDDMNPLILEVNN